MKTKTFTEGGSKWTVIFDDDGAPLEVRKTDVVWGANAGAASTMMAERVRRVIELARQDVDGDAT